jgi:hypothetical protein
MTNSWTVVISGIGSAIVTGAVGILSAVISYRSSSRQLHNQLKDNENNRRHQIMLHIFAKRQQAIEDIWRLLFILECQDALNDKELDVYIRSLIWLPRKLRQTCLAVIESINKKSPVNLTPVRDSLFEEANSIEFTF